MTRYITRPRSDSFDLLLETPLLEGRTVIEREARSIGLINQDGHPIYRTPEPIGFVLLKEKN